ncbi:hypothetical protein [Microbacterium gubbeenense]|uniref:hypothetical protein n=1 Tax=Microbacterium gubbeenense TaxID=159896 RepID=UPI003F9B4093
MKKYTLELPGAARLYVEIDDPNPYGTNARTRLSQRRKGKWRTLDVTGIHSYVDYCHPCIVKREILRTTLTGDRLQLTALEALEALELECDCEV